MPQPSINYACGRVGALGRTALHKAQLERLLSTRSYEEANRTLSDIGFAAADNADFQSAVDQHVLKACQLIRAVTPDPLVTDCFFLRYDVHNLKVLMKSRLLAQQPRFLSACGTISPDKLRHCVADHTYALLPKAIKDAMNALEKQNAVAFDPMLIDTELDKAMYRQIFENLALSTQGDVAKRYFQAKADLQNAIMLLRLKAMGKDAAFFENVALPGGNVKPSAFAIDFSESERFARPLRRYSVDVYQAATEAAVDFSKLPYLEKVTDDYLYSLLRPHRYDAASIEVLISFLLQKQREATDVRLIMAGKLNGFKPEAVAERMRELNG